MKPDTSAHPSLERITISLPRGLAKKIEDHWHENRLSSRSEAIRVLVENGLASLAYGTETAEK